MNTSYREIVQYIINNPKKSQRRYIEELSIKYTDVIKELQFLIYEGVLIETRRTWKDNTYTSLRVDNRVWDEFIKFHI